MNSEKPDYNYLFKIVIIGDRKTGKTCLMNRFVDNTWGEEYRQTNLLHFKVKTIYIDCKIIKLQIWDGQTDENLRFNNNNLSNYRSASGFLVTYDCTNENSFSNLKHWIKDIKLYGRPNSMKKSLTLSLQSLGIPFIETSSKHSSNVEDCFFLLIKNVMKYLETESSIPQQQQQPQQQQNQQSSKIGCLIQ
ncbi:hypothetical protein ACTFIY_007794 [Dictyostelium cf. discoideum]